MSKDEAKAGVRLQKRMAQLGYGSRRECERLMSAGRVSVDGKKVTELGTRVRPGSTIEVQGMKQGHLGPMWIALHKPPGFLTARTDPQGRDTIYDLLGPELPFLAHVGRLDFNTEGLLLMTNEGDVAQALLAPDSRCPRAYEVKVRGRLSDEAIKKLEAGIPLDGRPTLPVIVERISTRSRHDWLRLTLFEGRNRHVRRIMEAVGSQVNRLRRVGFGPIELDRLPTGSWRELEPEEIASLKSAAGM